MSIIPKIYIDAVVSIGVPQNIEKTSWIGTGFFVVREGDKNKFRPFLVTNKHIVENYRIICIRMIKKDTNDMLTLNVPLYENNNTIVRFHKNNEIDIAVIPLNADFINQNNLQFPAFDIDKDAMNSLELRQNGVDEGSLIYMLGFPMGLVNISSNQPICRLGCIARMNEAQVNEEKNFLVDIQNFPGNSGSPIIFRPEIVSIEGTQCLNESVLIGIIHSYIPYQESLINTQTKQVVEIRSENSGIAKAHPVEFIREIIDEIQPKYVQK